MMPLGPDARALVEAERDEAPLSVDERDRVRANLLAAVAGGGALTTAGAAGAAGAKAGLAKVIAGTAGVMVAGAWAYQVARAPEPPRPEAYLSLDAASLAATASRAEPVAAPAVSRETSVASPPATERPSAVKRRERKESSAPVVSAESDFAADARLLRDVHAALSSGDGEKALSMLEARRANGGAGVLAEEREAARLVTSCKLGRRTQVAAAAQRFLNDHGNSPLAERVRQACLAKPAR